ncbi:MAG: preprotein translocase subunit SecA [Verrucomicrobiaceae bacterium]|nr:preprotein translocase subunit SecA [Verrucomicrobiaceae bacterium]
MIAKILKLFAGSHYKKFYKKARPIVAKINELEKQYQSLSDEQLQAKTPEFKQRLANGETLDQILPEAFAVVKNAARRLCGKKIIVCDHEIEWQMVHYDVQLIGGIALHQNMIAEMATGEGKTLVATLPLYLNALTGKGCHLVTVNEYLARRDSEWMGYLYNFLGLSVSWIYNMQDMQEKSQAYKADITYGTASEFGFDYLRDNGMASSAEAQVQRPHYYCIVDEVDSILIDEARTPLIISGPVQEEREAPYNQLKPLIEKVVKLQNHFCNRLINDVREAKELNKVDEAAIIKMWQVKMGAPKNRMLRQLMEDADLRKRLDKMDMEMAADFRKEDRFKFKEELYYVIDEKQHSSDLTERGRNAVHPENPDAFVLPDLPTIFIDIDADKSLSPQEKQQKKLAAEEQFIALSEDIHCISQLLRAYSIYEKDIEYVVQDGKVHIVDPNTGRIMYGRRWSEGLHQAVEAKEGVAIEKETKTYATITIQNYFRLYEKLAGMTGTAETEAQEFHDIYGLNVMAIPTNVACQRVDKNDVIYKTRREKFNAAIDEIVAANGRGQPVLVGTASVEASEVLSRMLKRKGIEHTVLNAKLHQQEAEIVAQAGQRGAVTIATNMAGRGTDIKLGEGVNELGGLYVLGTERHESRRIDRQLRGRCARQGDNGLSKFLVSLEDDLLRIFGSGPLARILNNTFQEGAPLDHPLLNRSIERAQKTVEGQNYSMRKRLLQFDDVLNKQREIIYGLRNECMHSDTPRKLVFDFIIDELDERISNIMPADGNPEPEALQELCSWVTSRIPMAVIPEQLEGKDAEDMRNVIMHELEEVYKVREEVENPDALKAIERFVVLHALDKNWQDHLTEMEDLRRSIGLRGYGQKDPLNEYKSEAFKFFEALMGKIRNDVMLGLFRSASSIEVLQAMLEKLDIQSTTSSSQSKQEQNLPKLEEQPVKAEQELKIPEIQLPKIGRNDTVVISKGGETQKIKFKKAERLIKEEGWRLEEW